MKKIENVKEFVERIDSSKKVNPKDLSSDQDLTIAIMNLISIEEHLVFSGAKTGKNSFYDLIEEVREKRDPEGDEPGSRCNRERSECTDRRA